jgi:hypothetical protein
MGDDDDDDDNDDDDDETRIDMLGFVPCNWEVSGLHYRPSDCLEILVFFQSLL